MAAYLQLSCVKMQKNTKNLQKINPLYKTSIGFKMRVFHTQLISDKICTNIVSYLTAKSKSLNFLISYLSFHSTTSCFFS